MSEIYLEHVNITVRDPKETAALYCKLFGWKIRWQGDAKSGGHTIHVGGKNSYVALYTKGDYAPAPDSYSHIGGINHIAVIVDDLDAMEERVRAAGCEIHSHADYEPGRRFYFNDPDAVEVEVVSYA
ncbi:MAG TPA: VOC family protein [Rhodobacteraceae bacterium]|nr:VOC family protein [Paracoccaceae bacterium]